MLKIKVFPVIFALFPFQSFLAQSIEISGKVQSKLSVEGIHVINKTAQVFTVTNERGAFKINVALNDSLVFSSIQHKLKKMVISKDDMSNKAILVTLEEQINELDEVMVGKVLTGDLLKDIASIEGKPPINFFDVGIPGYTGKIATQSERRLSEAGEFKPKMLLGLLGGGVPLNPILNGISGRTKMLKNRVEIETKETWMHTIKARFSKDFFAINPLDKDLRMDFFYFCADDKNFIKNCKNKTDFEILVFLKYKYKQYLKNLQVGND
ncbi:carboxypeptidase-like regulatory domain-containing protein [Flavivirga sp. 57AJ16]|uniref:carboxypeptidase-like regulatory domain-containing protein n=1 Tax=Flavivirga sp. 57AJ16 TaxID=3025307 RepID=UPI002366EDD9|nr:carboxypeptidase-like regulatory domain-containing protein [Flavivirga sp. 57AJ16]MDD7886662.1 carboxypeptidase-like regulatory domain-containing protein [Flavivirga sp. 57AJ16]